MLKFISLTLASGASLCLALGLHPPPTNDNGDMLYRKEGSGRHFSGRQPGGLNKNNLSIFRLQDKSSSRGGAMRGIKNTSARVCAKNAGGGGGLMHEGGIFAENYGIVIIWRTSFHILLTL